MSSSFPDQLQHAFHDEALERIAELEVALLELSDHPDDGALVDLAFRALHTIKGSGAMFGLVSLSEFAHQVEAVFDAVRAKRLAVSPRLIHLALAAKDLIRELLEGDVPEARRQGLAGELRALVPAAVPGSAPRAPVAEAAAPSAREPPGTYRIRLAPDETFFRTGNNVLGYLAELRTLGPCEILCRADALPGLEALEPGACFLEWEIVLTCARGRDAIGEVLAFIEDRCRISVELEPAERAPASAPCAPRAPEEQPPTAARAERRREVAGAGAAVTTVRVAAAKLDKLVDLVGELVTAQARLTRLSAESTSPALVAVAEDIEKLTTELRDQTLEVRMVPIGTTFGRFKRLVHDLSSSLGKEIELVTEGGDTELDKTLIDRLGDPLVHIIRNGCDHGIEPPSVRLAAGKPGRGRIRLSAAHVGSSVVIEIQDDGAGLDAAAIEARARERGLIAPGAHVTERELFHLVFLPGFSTAQRVTNVSGRGVGMDVVQRAVEALRGTISIASVRGQGTTLRIQLPLTLAIIEGLLVSAGGSRVLVPLSAVEECVGLTRQDVERARGSRVASVRGELIPYLRLRDVLGASGPPPEREQLVILRHPDGRRGLVVDAVLGQHQAVIKPLGSMFRRVKGLSGASVLGDGTVALIIDPLASIPSAAVAA
jgi:two-component system chemotaxis sensor kinase CheA